MNEAAKEEMLTSGSKLELGSSDERAKPINVAIDGPAGAGKSTVAQKVAAEMGFLYIDTGAMYRAATWIALEKKIDPTDAFTIVGLVEKASVELKPGDASSNGRVRVFVNGDDVTFIVRSRIISKFVSTIAALPGVRKILVQKQQAMATRGGVVMDGRDIGTVVLPDAQVKVYLTASANIRAERRLKELKEMGQIADLHTLLSEIEARDQMDYTRAVSPLKRAEDAIEISTDELSIDEVVGRVLALAKAAAQA